ncbi:Arginine--tRNA ligase [Gammaproteobacteria bacterium]
MFILKHYLEGLLTLSCKYLETQLAGSVFSLLPATLERSKDRSHGEFSSNIALVLAKPVRRNPRELAEELRSRIPSDPFIARIEVAGPGFLNFFLSPLAHQEGIRSALVEGVSFGCSNFGKGQSVQVEFVSANPTGPLHVGHGRGAAYGAAVSNLLGAVGFCVSREYYVNDAGRQMDILAVSIWLRYLALCGESLRFPANGYQGDYVWDIAATLHRTYSLSFHFSIDQVLVDLPEDAPNVEERVKGDGPSGDKELYIDALINRAKYLLGREGYRKVFDLGLKIILDNIREDLKNFGVLYDEWYSERSLGTRVDEVVHILREKGHLYEKEGAWWFRSTAFGDEKDRVVVRENGQITYFASDIAYHLDKFNRGFDKVVNVWGADHHGYVPRLKAALSALEIDPKKLDVLLVQFAILYRSGTRFQMSTRSGEFVTLQELRDEVGRDAARFFYVLRAPEQHMDFDLDLAKSQSNENPVYYCQYAHARIQSIFRTMIEKGFTWSPEESAAHLDRLTEEREQILMATVSRYPETVEVAAVRYAPHLLAHYLREISAEFHGYYNSYTFLVQDPDLRSARLSLISAVRQTLANGLALLGVSAPDTM